MAYDAWAMLDISIVGDYILRIGTRRTMMIVVVVIVVTSQCGPNSRYDEPQPPSVHGHWLDWPSSAAAAHGPQNSSAAGPVRPVTDKYAFHMRQTSKRKHITIA